MLTPPGPLDYERHSLRWILYRLMGEDQDLETLCKYIPRIAGAAANIRRIEATLESGKPADEANAVRKALQELLEERADLHEEDTSW